jgi:hypothetical protein
MCLYVAAAGSGAARGGHPVRTQIAPIGQIWRLSACSLRGMRIGIDHGREGGIARR